jgi:hypothetical protein
LEQDFHISLPCVQNMPSSFPLPPHTSF